MSNVRECGKAVQRALALGFLLCLGTLGHRTLAQAPASPTRPLVEVRTDLGRMVLALYNETPLHRDNFLKLVRTNAYDSLLFHRVVPGFMAQGGDPESKHAGADVTLGNGGPGYSLPAEVVQGLVHKKGAIGAARQGEDARSISHSNGSQFYVVEGKTYNAADLDQVAQRNARFGTPTSWTEEQKQQYAIVGGAPHLDGAYTVFGEVVEGIEVLDALSTQACDARDRPLKDIRMFMRVLE